MDISLQNQPQVEEPKKKKKKKSAALIATVFKNALRSNLDLTALADKKAGILISINGFILTVIVTASGFAVHNPIMNYAFAAIILTSLFSIIFAVMAVHPRMKDKLVEKKYLDEYSSLLYYQDMADLAPNDYIEAMDDVLESYKISKKELTKHLHILGAEIKKKYFWLKQAYTFFSVGLLVSASLVIYGLMYVEQTPFYNLSKGNVSYKSEKFYNIFEPSGVTTLPDNRILVIEDEDIESIKILEIDAVGNIKEDEKVEVPKEFKKAMKKGVEDMEALTSNGNIVYAITSHTPSRTAKAEAQREQLIRFRFNEGIMEELSFYGNLKADLEFQFPEIFKKSLFNLDSMNIEALAYEKETNTLLIGFRAPIFNSQAIIIGIANIEACMSEGEKPQFTKPILLNLGGDGLRDMVYDDEKGGFWLIAGSSSDRESTFKLWFWNKKSNELKFVKNQPDIGYGEGIAVVNKESKRAGLLIVQDNGKKPNKPADYIVIDRNSLE